MKQVDPDARGQIKYRAYLNRQGDTGEQANSADGEPDPANLSGPGAILNLIPYATGSLDDLGGHLPDFSLLLFFFASYWSFNPTE